MSIVSKQQITQPNRALIIQISNQLMSISLFGLRPGHKIKCAATNNNR